MPGRWIAKRLFNERLIVPHSHAFDTCQTTQRAPQPFVKHIAFNRGAYLPKVQALREDLVVIRVSFSYIDASSRDFFSSHGRDGIKDCRFELCYFRRRKKPGNVEESTVLEFGNLCRSQLCFHNRLLLNKRLSI